MQFPRGPWSDQGFCLDQSILTGVLDQVRYGLSACSCFSPLYEVEVEVVVEGLAGPFLVLGVSRLPLAPNRGPVRQPCMKDCMGS